MRGIVNAFRTLALLAACLQVQSPARAYDIDNPGTIGIPVRTIKALQCEFTVNHTGTIGRSYRSGNSGEKLNITFAGLDFVKMTGQMIGNAGASEVIVLLSQGNTRAETARICGISVHTVSDYAKHGYRKLGIRNRAQAADLMLKHTIRS